MRWLAPLLLLTACSVSDDKADCVEKCVAPPSTSTLRQEIVNYSDVTTVQTVEIVASKLLSRHILIVGDSEACVVGNNRDVITKFNDEHGQPHDAIDIECKTSTRVQYWGADGNFQAALSKHPNPDVVLVFLGTNHWWNDRTTPDVRPLLEVVERSKFDCIWVGNTAVRGKRWPINGMLRTAVTPTCGYFDTEAADIHLRDGIHPGREGAVKWITAIWQTIPLKFEDAD